jgi:peptide/nickel transport system permease protein
MRRTLKKLVFVEPKSTHLHIYSRVCIPRLGSVLLGTIMRAKGYDVRVYIEDIQDVDMQEVLSADLVAISAIIGIVVGGVSGYFGGRIDEILMRIVDILFAFPGLILAVVIVAVLGPGLEKVLIALSIVGWPGYARLLRGEILSVRERDFVEAARAMGASDFKIIARHVLPNSIYPVLVVASLDMGSIVVAAAALSFLGLGAPPGYADWGQIISLSRNWIIGSGGNAFIFWYTVVFPGAALFLFTLGWNLLGDAFRDILDPRLRGST